MSLTEHDRVGPLSPLRLTPRQLDVLALLLQGDSNKVIARSLSISIETVKEHVAAVLHRLGVSSRAKIPMTVHPFHEPLLEWDAARRGAVRRPFVPTTRQVEAPAGR
jgi:DNA-binding CsgD family transcriptional regulator